MTNPFYNASGNPQTGASGLSAVIRNEFASIAAGFAALPTIASTGAYTATFALVGNYTYTLPGASGTLATVAELTSAVATETTRAQAAEATLTTSVSTEVSRATTAEALLAPKANPTFTAGVFETRAAVSASNIDCQAGTFFTKTISGTTTFTVSNVPSSGTVASFVLELTNGGSATVNWWSGMKWASGIAPALTTSGVDVLGFYTLDGGTTWRGLVLGKAMA